MKKTCLKLLSLFVAFFLLVSVNLSLAASLSLTQIGTLSTGGKTYSEWWYTGTNPTLAGTAGAGSTVSIDINGTTETVTADSSGNWSYPTSTLSSGDHLIAISASGEVYSFTLHAGQDFPGVGAVTGEKGGVQSTVPESGSNQLISFALFTGFAAFGFYLYKTRDPKKLFEKNVLKD